MTVSSPTVLIDEKLSRVTAPSILISGRVPTGVLGDKTVVVVVVVVVLVVVVVIGV